MEKVILDTDIGSDIDDAVCLAYLLAHDDCKLLGITTVTGEPQIRARLASALCEVAGKKIPIYPGTSDPLLTAIKQPYVPQANALSRWPHNNYFPDGQSIDFIRETVRENPGEVTLLAIGAMTNIALLFKLDPEIPYLLKQLVLMCGVFTNQLPHVGPLEWNAIGDPYATAIVYQTKVPSHRSIGLDVTCQVQMNADEVQSKFKSPLLQPVLDWSDIWFKDRPSITFHDPLAAAIIFNDDLCTFTKGQVSVELESEKLRGLTHWNAGENGDHSVALSVDPGRFFTHFFNVFT